MVNDWKELQEVRRDVSHETEWQAKKRVESLARKAGVSNRDARRALSRNSWCFDSAFRELTGQDWRKKVDGLSKRVGKLAK